MTMKIILTRPNYKSHLITPPLGLGYLSSYLRQDGYHVKIIDGLNLGYSNDRIVEICNDADIVGITCLSDYFLETIDLCRKLKDKRKTVIIGGPHATSLPEQTLSETGADYVIVGEGEQTILELVESLNNGKQRNNIPGIYSGKTTNFRKRAFVANLDELPFPDWEQLDPRSYKKAPHGGLVRSFPVAPILTTRGCPFECTFCASPKIWDKTIRFRSPENVIEEIKQLVNKYGVSEIHFEDDNLTLKKSHVVALCNLIIENKIKINWATPNGIRVETVTPDLLRLMKRSGCYSIAYGVESGSQEILDNIKKKTKLETIEYAVNEADKAGIVTQGFFIFGLPGETSETIKQTIDFAKRIKLDKAQFLLLDVLPGTGIAEQLKEKFQYDWSKTSFQETTWIPETVSQEELAKAQAAAFRGFFLRPRQIWYIIKYFKFKQIIFIIKRISDFKVLKLKNDK
jgi:anaerobic magnesium-protoporphyrin IX monomethyl ester cyclase